MGVANAQTKVISGTVTGADDGMAIPGVTVMITGTTIGITTDFDGKFTLSVPVDAQSISFSFIGMVKQDIEIGNQTVFNVQLETSATALNEVVVTALGIKREKREITYQTEKVVGEDLLIVAPTRAASALAGKVAGLQINIQDNGVNPSSQILLRGLRSVSGNNSALIVIDGSISSQSAFDDLNPYDIKDLSVLKGATAAALYGSRAANGALLVTTKKGKKGSRLVFGANLSYTMEKVAYTPDFQSEYGTGWEGAYDNVENTNWGPRFDGTMRQIGPTFPADYGLATQIVPYSPIQNNLLDFYNTGNTLNNTFYFTAGDENSSFYASFGDQRSNGIVPDDTYGRNTVRVNASKKVGNIELSVNASYFNDRTDVVGGSIGDQNRPLYWFVLNTPTNIPLSSYSDWEDPLGYGYADNYYNAYYQNPYWGIGTNRNTDQTNRFNGNFNFSWDIKDNVNLTTRIAANNSWGNGKNWRARQTYNSDLQGSHSTVSSFVTDSEFQSKNYTGDIIVNADFEYKEDFTLRVIAGGNITSNEFRSSFIQANNLSIPNFYDVSNGTGSLNAGVNESVQRNYAFYGDLTFGYNNYIFLNVSGRNDWTSTLAAENNSYFYPSFGLSFVFTDAIDALKDNDILSYGKITLSNSTVYNDLAPYRINENYSQAGGFPFGGINGFALSNVAVDANITKERINTTELGINLGFFSGRAHVDFAYFDTKTSDLITFTTPSVASASTSFLTNIGSLQGKGMELTIGGTVIRTKDFKWDVNINYTNLETKVIEIYEGLDEIQISGTGQYGIFAVVGEAFPQMKANVYQRDDLGRIIVDAADGVPLTADGLESLGKTTPDYILGFNSMVKYKGISLSVTVDYRTGHVYYEQGSAAMEFTGRSMASISANRQDFVIPNSVYETSPGVYVENTNIQVANGRQGYWTDAYNDVRSNYVKDASAFKIRELALGYELPTSLLKKTPLSKVTIGFIARNIFTALPADNRFSDPEFNNSNSNAIGIGGYFQSPPTKSYGFSLNIEF